jgi:hypothetical protein
MRDHQMDPEVLADIAKRDRIAASRDPMAFEPALRAAVAKIRPVFVGAWKCRTCNALVPVQEQDLENLASCNDALRRRGEEPLDHNRIMFCDSCREAHKLDAARRRRREVERLAEVIRALKSAADPDSERALIHQLRELNHPDVDGLLNALRERANKPAKSAPKGRERF